MPSVKMLEADLAVLVVIDVQEKMLRATGTSSPDAIIDRMRRLIDAAKILNLPILYTEQYPQGLGHIDERLRSVLPPQTVPIVKTTCSCWRDPAFRRALQETEREHVILCGLETHVCIQQTALDLIRVDYVPFIAVDAVGSRRESDMRVALDRMKHNGAELSTAEAIIFELVERCDHPRFKDILQLVK